MTRFDFGLTDAQEERATRLHRDSIVIDFMSRHAGSEIFDDYPPELRAELDELLATARSKNELLDLAIHWPFELSLEGRSHLVRDRLLDSGLTCGVYEVALHVPMDARDALAWDWDARLARYTAELPWLRHARTADDVRAAHRDGVHALYANCQPIIPAPRDLDALDDAHARGLRSLMLTYNRMDHIGVGCTERVDAGLSSYGLRVVERCNDLGILVDVSHTGHLSTMDACRASRRPVTANHTLARAVFDHARGKTDDALRAVADTGGVIGVVAVPFFLSAAGAPSMEDMLDHIDYIADLVGWRHVAIGTDFPWPVPQVVLDASVDAAHDVNAGFRPEDRVDRTRRLVGFEDCRDLPNITRGLVARGYDDDQIRGILGENALRVMDEVWG